MLQGRIVLIPHVDLDAGSRRKLGPVYAYSQAVCYGALLVGDGNGVERYFDLCRSSYDIPAVAYVE